MYRAFLLYGELRYIYRLPTDEAPERLDAWLAWASRSRLKPFVKLARHDPQTQDRRARRDQARLEQWTPRGTEQQGETPVKPRLRIPLRRRPDRNDLPLLRRHPDRASSPMSHPQTKRRAVYRAPRDRRDVDGWVKFAPCGVIVWSTTSPDCRRALDALLDLIERGPPGGARERGL